MDKALKISRDEILSGWASNRVLRYSATKSLALLMKGKLRPSFSISFGTGDIRAVSSVRYLSVELDYKLNF